MHDEPPARRPSGAGVTPLPPEVRDCSPAPTQRTSAWEIIDRIAHKYIGAQYPLRTDRVLFLVDAERAWAQAFG